MEPKALLETYISRGGKDLGEFLLGTEERRAMEPAPDEACLLGNFNGLQEEAGTNFAGLARMLFMKGSSLKRMIGNNRIGSGDVIAKCEHGLGIEAGTSYDAMFWYLARGDKSLPGIEEAIKQGQEALAKEGANAQKIARDMALTLFQRSGYTHEKFSELSGRQGMVKELTRNEGYQFSGKRAGIFADAIAPGQKSLADSISNLFIGRKAGQQIDALVTQLSEEQITFGALLKEAMMQRRESEGDFAKAFTEFLAEEGIVKPSPVISPAMVNKWANDKVLPQSRGIARELAEFLGFQPEQYSLVPYTPEKGIPKEERTKPEEWIQKIRAGEISFPKYIQALLDEEGLSHEAFGKTVRCGRTGVEAGTVSRWVKGKDASHHHAEALADRAGYKDKQDRKDFIAFARTGILDRSNVVKLVNRLLSEEMHLSEFIFQLRSEEGMTPEEFDKEIGLGKGTVRNMEAGRQLRTESAETLTVYFLPYLKGRQEEFLNHVCACVASLEMPSASNLDPEGYCQLVSGSMEFLEGNNLRKLREETPGLRFDHYDPVVECWWRALASEYISKGGGSSGTLQQTGTNAFNDVYDVLFNPVDPNRLASKEFKENIEDVAAYVGGRKDMGTARRALTATVCREMNNLPPEQRHVLVQFSGALNVDFMTRLVEEADQKFHGGITVGKLWEKTYDAFTKIIDTNMLNRFVTMDAYVRTTVSHAAIDVWRSQKRHASSVDEETLENIAPHKLSVDYTKDNNAEDIFRVLNETRENLSPNSRETLDAMLSVGGRKRAMHKSVAEMLDIPEGTAKSRIYALRNELAQIPELVKAMEDIFGSSYAENFKERGSFRSRLKDGRGDRSF